MEASSPTLVSVHGGHSGEFCSHARDPLAAVVAAYAAQGFAWVGLTEHAPASSRATLPADEAAAGLDAAATQRRFAVYIETARALQREYVGRLSVWVGFETEAWSGWRDFFPTLIAEYQPDYLVGSVHHVHDILIDGDRATWLAAAQRAGGAEALYCDYFDLQHELLLALEPGVVGHLDLIRLFDPEYPEHLARPEVWRRILRNLDLVAELGAILDCNVRALAKGQHEPYPSRPILEEARRRGVRAAPGDDSHGVDDVGLHVRAGAELLAELGFDTDWPVPGRSRA